MNVSDLAVAVAGIMMFALVNNLLAQQVAECEREEFVVVGPVKAQKVLNMHGRFEVALFPLQCEIDQWPEACPRTEMSKEACRNREIDVVEIERVSYRKAHEDIRRMITKCNTRGESIMMTKVIAAIAPYDSADWTPLRVREIGQEPYRIIFVRKSDFVMCEEGTLHSCDSEP